jgi:thiamine transporter ThiT
MNEFLQRDLDYVMRLDEVLWGCLLLAITLSIHVAGLFRTMRVSLALMGHPKKLRPGFDMGVVILVALMLIVLHLIEVTVWAGFFTWKGAQPNPFSAFYNALVNYTTLGAGYLPLRWRLLEGMLGMAGLLSFAFSTSALFALAQALMRPAWTEQQQKD